MVQCVDSGSQEILDKKLSSSSKNWIKQTRAQA